MPLPFPNSHLYMVAINEYEDDDINDLYSPVNDAVAIEQLLGKSPHSFIVHRPKGNTHDDIISLLKNIALHVQPQDRILFYFAGHGITLNNEAGKPEGYLIPCNGRLNQDGKNWISMAVLLGHINQINCLHALLVLDCCFAGSIVWADYNYRDLRLKPRQVFKEHFDFFIKERAWQVITSAAFDQTAKDVGWRNDPNKPVSPFVEALVKGLSGAADFVTAAGLQDGIITITELAFYLRQELEQKTAAAGIVHRQTPRLINLQRHDKGEYVFLNPSQPILRLNSAVEATRQNNPFKGLQTYEENDAEKFFGRNRVSGDIVKKIQEHFQSPVTENLLIVVTGISGSGKSSVIKAGIMPQLKERGWHCMGIIRPGEEPLKSFALLTEPDRAGQSFVVVDQLEELVTQNKSAANADTFMRLLHTLYKRPEKIVLIFTLRSDFENLIPKKKFAAVWNHSVYPLPWFERTELKDIIIRPAANIAFFYDPVTLTDQIIDEVLQYPGSLPLLSVLLSSLYLFSIKRIKTEPDYRRLLYEEDYRAIRGVPGALQAQLQAVADNPKTNMHSLRAVLLRMVDIEGGFHTRKKATRQSLNYDASELLVINNTIELLREERVITTVDGQPGTWEPVHDAVVRWEKLGQWIDLIGSERLAVQRELENDIDTYISNRRKKNDLWHNNDRLDRLQEELSGNTADNTRQFPMNKREKQFISDSYTLKQKNKRNRRREWAAIFSTLFIALLVALYFLFQSKENERQAKTNEDKAVVNATIAKANENRADSNARVVAAREKETKLALRQYQREKFGSLILNGDIYLDAKYYHNAKLQYDSANAIRLSDPADDSVLNRQTTVQALEQKIRECKIKLTTD